MDVVSAVLQFVAGGCLIFVCAVPAMFVIHFVLHRETGGQNELALVFALIALGFMAGNSEHFPYFLVAGIIATYFFAASYDKAEQEENARRQRERESYNRDC